MPSNMFQVGGRVPVRRLPSRLRCSSRARRAQRVGRLPPSSLPARLLRTGQEAGRARISCHCLHMCGGTPSACRLRQLVACNCLGNAHVLQRGELRQARSQGASQPCPGQPQCRHRLAGAGHASPCAGVRAVVPVGQRISIVSPCRSRKLQQNASCRQRRGTAAGTAAGSAAAGGGRAPRRNPLQLTDSTWTGQIGLRREPRPKRDDQKGQQNCLHLAAPEAAAQTRAYPVP